jgi:ABC-type transporter Mla MlaB component
MARADSRTITFAVRGPIARADLPGLCDRACALLRARAGWAVDCQVSRVDADAVAVEALARLALAARRNGCSITIRGASPELRAIVALLGLTDQL